MTDLSQALARAEAAEARLAVALEALELFQTAISWVEPPFVDAGTSEVELRKRIDFLLADATRAAQALGRGDGRV